MPKNLNTLQGSLTLYFIYQYYSRKRLQIESK